MIDMFQYSRMVHLQVLVVTRDDIGKVSGRCGGRRGSRLTATVVLWTVTFVACFNTTELLSEAEQAQQA